MSALGLFEADLEPQTGSPRIRLNFNNGWAISILLVMPAERTMCALASVAACRTGEWGTGQAELLNNEAYTDEVAQLIAEVASRPVHKAALS